MSTENVIVRKCWHVGKPVKMILEHIDNSYDAVIKKYQCTGCGQTHLIGYLK